MGEGHAAEEADDDASRGQHVARIIVSWPWTGHGGGSMMPDHAPGQVQRATTPPRRSGALVVSTARAAVLGSGGLTGQ